MLAASGTISSRGPGTDGATRQRNALVGEGVDVVTTRAGDFKVDLRAFGWFPAVGTVDIGIDVDEEEGGGEDEDEGAEG